MKFIFIPYCWAIHIYFFLSSHLSSVEFAAIYLHFFASLFGTMHGWPGHHRFCTLCFGVSLSHTHTHPEHAQRTLLLISRVLLCGFARLVYLWGVLSSTTVRFCFIVSLVPDLFQRVHRTSCTMVSQRFFPSSFRQNNMMNRPNRTAFSSNGRRIMIGQVILSQEISLR